MNPEKIQPHPEKPLIELEQKITEFIPKRLPLFRTKFGKMMVEELLAQYQKRLKTGN